MARPNIFKFKQGSRWLNARQLQQAQEEERSGNQTEIPHINLDFLPPVAALDELEEDEVLEYYFLCESIVETSVEGVVSRNKCGNKFSTEDSEDVLCPLCNGGDLKSIPRAFLRLYGTNEIVRRYVTDEMVCRGGLPVAYRKVAQQIIDKYGGANIMNNQNQTGEKNVIKEIV